MKTPDYRVVFDRVDMFNSDIRYYSVVRYYFGFIPFSVADDLSLREATSLHAEIMASVNKFFPKKD